jgi:CBS domain-containing protein
MKVREVMTREVELISPHHTLEQAAQLMAELDAGVLPVSDKDRLVGIITDRDIALRVVADGNPDAQVRDAMSKELTTARPDDSVKDVMAKMANERVRRIPIVDEQGMVVGIVAQADIVLEADDRKAERTIERISEPGR